jgi:ferredoxin-thioredoxin reductase catalytic subunit
LEAKINDLAEKNSAAHETIYKELVAQREAQLIANGNVDKELALLKQADFFQRQLNDCRYYTTKKVVAKDDICPGVMPEFNSWTAPTAPTTAG